MHVLILWHQSTSVVQYLTVRLVLQSLTWRGSSAWALVRWDSLFWGGQGGHSHAAKQVQPTGMCPYSNPVLKCAAADSWYLHRTPADFRNSFYIDSVGLKEWNSLTSIIVWKAFSIRKWITQKLIFYPAYFLNQIIKCLSKDHSGLLFPLLFGGCEVCAAAV